MDYWNVVIDRAVGTEITIDMTDIYLQKFTDPSGEVHYAAHNKHTDQAWGVSEETYTALQQRMEPRQAGIAKPWKST